MAVTNNQISDVSPLAGLANLYDLWLENNEIDDLSPLAGLNLRWRMKLSGNQISDLAPLAGMTKLRWLELSSNRISDVSPLVGVTLAGLYLDDNQIEDLSPLAGLSGLGLNLCGFFNCGILDVSGNPLNCLTYCKILPLIEANNPGADIAYDPIPEHCDCDSAGVFIRGNADAQDNVDIADAIFTLSYLFLGEAAPPCLDAADTDDDGSVGMTDAIAVLGFLFRGQAPPPSPFPDCDTDVTRDELTCDSFAGCQ